MPLNRNLDETVRKLTEAAMLGAAAAVLMLLDFPVPFVPPFVKFDLSEVPVLLGGLLLGPAWGLVVVALKIVLHLVLRGSVTVGIGELANFTGSAAYMLPAAFLARNVLRGRSSFLPLAAAVLTASCIVVAGNYFVFFPAYARLMGTTLDAFVAMGRAANPAVDGFLALMIYTLFPFNLFKYGVTSLLGALLYRRLKRSLVRRGCSDD